LSRKIISHVARIQIQGEKNKIDSVNNPAVSHTILLSGASGMLGGALRQALAGRGVSILQLVRRDPRSAGELRWDPSARKPVADLRPLEGLAAAIHLSGASIAAHRWTDAYKREMVKSRVESTHTLASVLSSLRQPPVAFVAASAAGFYGNRGDELLDEDSSPGSGFLATLCRAWEAASQPAIMAGIRVVHLRFGVVLDAKGGALARMLPLFRLGLGGSLGSGRQWMSWISLPDAVAALQFLVDVPALAGPVNLTAPEPVTNSEFTRALSRAVHRPAVLPAPAFALRLAFGQMADEALLASERVYPRRLISAGFQFAHPALAQALAAALGSDAGQVIPR
jgi:uncharacterized protein